MLTEVKRDIEDNSISGNKIFGDYIDYVAGVRTDDLYVPHHTGTDRTYSNAKTGKGRIDGLGFSIGYQDAIEEVSSDSVKTMSFILNEKHIKSIGSAYYNPILASITGNEEVYTNPNDSDDPDNGTTVNSKLLIASETGYRNNNVTASTLLSRTVITSDMEPSQTDMFGEHRLYWSDYNLPTGARKGSMLYQTALDVWGRGFYTEWRSIDNKIGIAQGATKDTGGWIHLANNYGGSELISQTFHNYNDNDSAVLDGTAHFMFAGKGTSIYGNEIPEDSSDDASNFTNWAIKLDTHRGKGTIQTRYNADPGTSGDVNSSYGGVLLFENSIKTYLDDTAITCGTLIDSNNIETHKGGTITVLKEASTSDHYFKVSNDKFEIGKNTISYASIGVNTDFGTYIRLQNKNNSSKLMYEVATNSNGVGGSYYSLSSYNKVVAIGSSGDDGYVNSKEFNIFVNNSGQEAFYGSVKANTFGSLMGGELKLSGSTTNSGPTVYLGAVNSGGRLHLFDINGYKNEGSESAPDYTKPLVELGANNATHPSDYGPGGYLKLSSDKDNTKLIKLYFRDDGKSVLDADIFTGDLQGTISNDSVYLYDLSGSNTSNSVYLDKEGVYVGNLGMDSDTNRPKLIYGSIYSENNSGVFQLYSGTTTTDNNITGSKITVKKGGSTFKLYEGKVENDFRVEISTKLWTGESAIQDGSGYIQVRNGTRRVVDMYAAGTGITNGNSTSIFGYEINQGSGVLNVRTSGGSRLFSAFQSANNGQYIVEGYGFKAAQDFELFYNTATSKPTAKISNVSDATDYRGQFELFNKSTKAISSGSTAGGFGYLNLYDNGNNSISLDANNSNSSAQLALRNSTSSGDVNYNYNMYLKATDPTTFGDTVCSIEMYGKYGYNHGTSGEASHRMLTLSTSDHNASQSKNGGGKIILSNSVGTNNVILDSDDTYVDGSKTGHGRIVIYDNEGNPKVEMGIL